MNPELAANAASYLIEHAGDGVLLTLWPVGLGLVLGLIDRYRTRRKPLNF